MSGLGSSPWPIAARIALIQAALSLRHDPLKAELIGFGEHDRTPALILLGFPRVLGATPGPAPGPISD